MPSKTEKQRKMMGIALHHPEKLYERNKDVLKMSHQQMHEFAIKSRKSTAGSTPFSPEEFQKGYRKIGN